MAKKSTLKNINENANKAMIEKQIRAEYSVYLKSENLNVTPHYAQCFAMKKIREEGGLKYHGFTER